MTHQLAVTLILQRRAHFEILRNGFEVPSGPHRGKLRGVVECAGRLDGHVLALCRELGMTPAARAKLGLDLARTVSAADALQAHLTENYSDDVVEGEAQDA